MYIFTIIAFAKHTGSRKAMRLPAHSLHIPHIIMKALQLEAIGVYQFPGVAKTLSKASELCSAHH